MSAPFHRRYPMSHIAQPHGSCVCWAACLAMLLRRDLNSVIAEARSHGVPLFEDNSLQPGAVDQLARINNLRIWERPRTLNVLEAQQVADWLQRSPALVFGHQSEVGLHVVVVSGMDWSHRADSGLQIWLHGVDPLQGAPFRRTLIGIQGDIKVHKALYR